ncbi:hypothetical protein ACFL21_01965 [Patescibacteria group bacterium]
MEQDNGVNHICLMDDEVAFELWDQRYVLKVQGLLLLWRNFLIDKQKEAFRKLQPNFDPNGKAPPELVFLCSLYDGDYENVAGSGEISVSERAEIERFLLFLGYICDVVESRESKENDFCKFSLLSKKFDEKFDEFEQKLKIKRKWLLVKFRICELLFLENESLQNSLKDLKVLEKEMDTFYGLLNRQFTQIGERISFNDEDVVEYAYLSLILKEFLEKVEEVLV